MTYEHGFAWTPELMNLSNRIWTVTSLVGAALCGAVLIVIGIVALKPPCRPHLDRVSFRIVVCALVANTIFGITNAIGGKFTGPTWACGFDIFLLQFTLETSSFLLFSIALNLQLVVVHQFNGQKMEKFYIVGSIIISLCLTVPPYALKQYGWDPLLDDCWYSNDNPRERLGWQIGTQLFWILLTVAGEVITTSTVVWYMIQHQLRQKRIQADITLVSVIGADDQLAHANFYRNTILRIVAYPITSALINLTSVACVIHDTRQDGVHNWTDYHVLLLGDSVYGGRTVVYALFAIMDPALVRAMRTFIRDIRSVNEVSTAGARPLRNLTDNNRSLSVHIELATRYQNDDGIVVDGDTLPAKSLAPQAYRPPMLKILTHIETPSPHAHVDVPPNEREIVARDRERQEEFHKQI
ncbi:hypothetical protein DFH08DRAFT_964811 [Mycena albidolilacea]|uniref:Uncharacterized protein n=1 Tax=Mycena albidolilacea TaxID=1033008 RepID=A0AAD7ELX5_9AGAR|nr:hypothetical protein DFH08DRAFT_964811 [Mycena albidolilacea]